MLKEELLNNVHVKYQSYASLLSAYEKMITTDPDDRLNAGLETGISDLPQLTREEIEASHDFALAVFESAQHIYEAKVRNSTELTAEEAANVVLIQKSAMQHMTTFMLKINGGRKFEQNPCVGNVVGDGIFTLMTIDTRDPAFRLNDILSRLKQVPRVVEQMLELLTTPVERWVQIEIDTIEGIPSLLSTVTKWATEVGYSSTPDLELAATNANSALSSYVEELKKLKTNKSFVIGEYAARHILDSTGINLDFSEIHKIACNFVSYTQSLLESLRVSLIAKYDLQENTGVKDLQKFLCEKYAVQYEANNFSSVIDRYKEENRKILGFVKDKGNLFPIPSSDLQDMQIIETPTFMAPMIPAGAMMPAQPLREGKKVSRIYLTLSEELMDEHTELSIPLMMIHEGIPGHHLQFASAGLNDSVVRATFGCNHHAEGWTTMLEDYMLDIGYMGDLTEESRFLAKLELCRIGARVGIDLYFMTGDKQYLDIGYDIPFDSDDIFVNAKQLLVEATGFTSERADAELNWYSLDPGYPLSYLVGNHLAWDLKKKYVGSDDSLEKSREFHEIFLSKGNMPIDMIADLMLSH